MNKITGDNPKILDGHIDTSFGSTIYNHYTNPIHFMEAVIADANMTHSETAKLVNSGIQKYKEHKCDSGYDTLYKDVAHQIKDKLHARGLTSKLLYRDVGFTSKNTGKMSKQRAMLGYKDRYYKTHGMSDKKLFHDLYINLSYPWGVPDSTIRENAYAIYAITKALANLISIRVIVVNHVGTDTPTCYSYILKQFGVPISPNEFMFFLSDSKRTFGWATYEMLNGYSNYSSRVGRPEGTVSIDSVNLDSIIDTLVDKVKTVHKV